MDARKNGRKQAAKEEIVQPENELEAESSVSNEELFMRMQNSTENIISHLDKLIQSSSKRSNKRAYLELFRALIEENAKYSESLIYLFEYVIDLRASILLLSAEMEKAKGRTTKDVKRLKSKLDNLLNSPAIVEIGKILENIRKISEERNEDADKNPAIDYLR
jgi:hypothetical protein